MLCVRDLCCRRRQDQEKNDDVDIVCKIRGFCRRWTRDKGIATRTGAGSGRLRSRDSCEAPEPRCREVGGCTEAWPEAMDARLGSHLRHPRWLEFGGWTGGTMVT